MCGCDPRVYSPRPSQLFLMWVRSSHSAPLWDRAAHTHGPAPAGRTERPFCSPACGALRTGGTPWRPWCRPRGRQGARRRAPAAMSELAREELSALAAIYCEPGACEVLAASGDAAALSAPSPGSPGRAPGGSAPAPLTAGFSQGQPGRSRSLLSLVPAPPVPVLAAALGARSLAGPARLQSGTCAGTCGVALGAGWQLSRQTSK